MIIPEELHSRWLAYESSPVDWCEDNFTVSPYVAEFTNTLSNAAMVLLPLFTLWSGVWDSYVTHISRAPLIVYTWQACIGLGSCYFHGTLSLFGQFLDEITQVWLLLVVYMFCVPESYLPKQVSQTKLNVFVSIIGVVFSLVWIHYAHLFAFLIWPVPMPLVIIGVFESCQNKYPETKKLFMWTIVGLLTIMVFWSIDQFHCETVKSYGLPGVHNIFHIFMGFIGSNGFTLLSFWKTKQVAASSKVISLKSRYWVIPYIKCENKVKT